MKRTGLWFVFLPVALFSLSATSVAAEAPSGLMVTGFTVDQIPPNREESYPVCGEMIYPNINWTWDYEQNHLGECGWDWFMVRFQGFVTVPDGVSSVRFAIASDDGGLVTIDGNTFGTWSDQGCSVTYDERRTFLTGEPLPLNFWFYENGGGTCAKLFWQLNGNDQDWAIVPEWAFTPETIPTTTTSTTTVPETTVPATTTTSTTVQETTTTVEPTTTTEESTTTSTTEAPSTGTSTSTPSTTSSVPPSTTTVDTSPPATLATPAEVVPPATATTEPSTTVPEELPEEEQQPLVTDPTVPDTASPSTLPTIDPDPEEPAVDLPVEDAPTMAPDAPESPESDATPEPVLETPETLLEALDAGEEPTPEQAASLATNPQVLATVSTAQAEAIFQALDIADLSPEQTEALIAAVQDAPLEIRETFEATIDIFKSGLDTYIPVGSNIPVGTRRTLVAIGAVLTMLPPPSRMRR